MTVEKAGTVASMPASISTSRAMLLKVRLGTTTPHTAKSGLPPLSWSTMCRATGTESSMASKAASGPSTLAKGVRTPAASQISTGLGIGDPLRSCRQAAALGLLAAAAGTWIVASDMAPRVHRGGVVRSGPSVALRIERQYRHPRSSLGIEAFERRRRRRYIRGEASVKRAMSSGAARRPRDRSRSTPVPIARARRPPSSKLHTAGPRSRRPSK